MLRDLPSDCFVYQRPTVLVPPVDFLDLDLALVDAGLRADAENTEIELVNHPSMGRFMEYAVLREVTR